MKVQLIVRLKRHRKHLELKAKASAFRLEFHAGGGAVRSHLAVTSVAMNSGQGWAPDFLDEIVGVRTKKNPKFPGMVKAASKKRKRQ
jgi:hypothetical protein